MVAKVHSFLRKDNKAAASDSRSRSSTVGSGQLIEVVWDMRQARSIYIFTRIRELHSVALFCVCSWAQLQAKWCKGRRVEWNPRSGRQVRHLSPFTFHHFHHIDRSIRTSPHNVLAGNSPRFGGKPRRRPLHRRRPRYLRTYDDDDDDNDHSIIPNANASSTINIKPCGV